MNGGGVVNAVLNVVPVWLRRLTRHEFLLMLSVLRWIARRPPHGVGPGDTAVPYAAAQTAIMLIMTFVSVLETVVLAILIPWPLVHAILLGVGIWGIFFGVALHCSCVVRPHVVGADGSLRLRYGALIDIRVPAERVAAVRLDRRYPGMGKLVTSENGTVDLLIAGETNLTAELTEPVMFIRPLGKRASASALRFRADDPDAVLAALADRPGLGGTSLGGTSQR
ncbi:hypothetical protein [Streptomyces litchfieldiae]|uniref:Integral membrane protein n=1 Tax=Streptomyces litchfieldiae TaxID=3075543 RepID=A0ABU2MK59_9ACTN|nr:hypothetical protein [Streptomyces sp. DSM 44938]MDT0341974.1 hypothetical protein [Streptomyces sp. DSM 44938]